MVPWWAAAITSTLVPIGTLVLGWFLNQRSDERRDTRARSIAQKVLEDERESARQQRREEFELRVLTDLHAAVLRYGRAVSRFHLEDLIAARRTRSQYGAHRLDVGELDEELRLSTVDVMALSQVVLNEDVRVQMAALREAGAGLGTMPTSIEHAEAEFQSFIGLLQRLTEIIGQEIRRLYEATPVVSAWYHNGPHSPDARSQRAAD